MKLLVKVIGGLCCAVEGGSKSRLISDGGGVGVAVEEPFGGTKKLRLRRLYLAAIGGAGFWKGAADDDVAAGVGEGAADDNAGACWTAERGAGSGTGVLSGAVGGPGVSDGRVDA